MVSKKNEKINKKICFYVNSPLDDPVKYLESVSETTEEVSGGEAGGQERKVKPSERPGFYWPIHLSTKVNDPGPEPRRATS